MLDTKTMTKVQADVVRKAFRHLNEAADLLCCCNSPYGSVRMQEKVIRAFVEFKEKLKDLK